MRWSGAARGSRTIGPASGAVGAAAASGAVSAAWRAAGGSRRMRRASPRTPPSWIATPPSRVRCRRSWRRPAGTTTGILFWRGRKRGRWLPPTPMLRLPRVPWNGTVQIDRRGDCDHCKHSEKTRDPTKSPGLHSSSSSNNSNNKQYHNNINTVPVPSKYSNMSNSMPRGPRLPPMVIIIPHPSLHPRRRFSSINSNRHNSKVNSELNNSLILSHRTRPNNTRMQRSNGKIKGLTRNKLASLT
mmetsp:Transcript_1476/g.3332  ORF Transcript_1476/g.3332 Transcript_1476/m.3332 type:complete len:243 (-) Transcript_1476:1815-2543(-)